jgi:chaperonin GroES
MTSVNIKVLRDFVALKKIDPPKTGIIEIVRTDDRLWTGEVIAVGTGVLAPNGEVHPIEVKIGDQVVFDRVNASMLEHKGEKYIIVNELSLRCILL